MKYIQINLSKIFLGCGFFGVVMMLCIPVVFKPSEQSQQLFTGYWKGEQYQDYWNARSSLFDHPEPNFAVVPGVAEFWSTLTTIPFAGAMLLASALRQDFDLQLAVLYAHVLLMYLGAFLSHLTLIPLLFTLTVSNVIANSLLAFFWWNHRLGGPFARHPRLFSWSGALSGLAAAVAAILTIQGLPCLAPIGGFVTLALVQPPFVFLGLCSAVYLLARDRSSEACRLLVVGGSLLMGAMLVSALETFVDPLLVGDFPLLHVVIHVMEQIGIYFYGVGTAALHYSSPGSRKRFVILSSFGVPRLLLLLQQDPSEALMGPSLNSLKSEDCASFDLLDPRPRCHPHTWNAQYMNSPRAGLCPVRFERDCFAVFDAQVARRVLAADHQFSSNPYPDERPIGLSTSAEPQHSVQRKAVAPFFAKPQLRLKVPLFQRIVDHWTDSFLENKGGDLVRQWAYRIAMSSALCALGVTEDSGDILDPAFIDMMGQRSVEMVQLMAPVGGMGLPLGPTVSQSWGLLKGVLYAVPDTLRLIQQVGFSSAWRLLRPDLNIAYSDPRTPRNGAFSCPSLLASAPRYFVILDRMWDQHATRKQGGKAANAFQALREAEEAGKISHSEGLLIIVQCLISMTTANALVNALHRLLHSPALRAQVASDPILLKSYIQETLRIDAPLQRLPRRATCPVTMSGVTVPQNSQLLLMIGACNQQEGGNDFNLVNSKEASNLTFGLGKHRCLGEALVRLEMGLALHTWLAKTEHLELKLTPGEGISNIDVGNFGFATYQIEL